MEDPTRRTESLAPPRLVIRLPGALRPLAGGRGDVAVAGATVADALAELARRHPGLQRHLWTEGGRLREHVNVFVGEEDVRALDGLETRVTEGQELFILPSIAGG